MSVTTLRDGQLEVYGVQQQAGLEQYNGFLSGNNLGCVPFPYYQPQIVYSYLQSPPRELCDYEIQITQFSAGSDPTLNYGAKLRLVMADPIKGHDLREALAKLKVALKEAFA